MKKCLSLLSAIGFVWIMSSFAVPGVSVHEPPAGPNAYLIQVPLGNTGKSMSYADFSKITPAEYKAATGKKLRFFEKIALKKATKKMRNSILEDGTVKSSLFTGAMLANGNAAEDFFSDFHIGGFALGLFLGPIGVIIAYFLQDGPAGSRRKWSWIGLIAFILLGGFLLF